MAMKKFKITYKYWTIHLGKSFQTEASHKPIIKAQNAISAINKLLKKDKYITKSDIIAVKEIY